MNVAQIGKLLQKERSTVAIQVPERTGLYDTATDNLGMVTAYLSDADAFLADGDWVNALAAYCYGHGWLHCGAACGLFTLQGTACPVAGRIEPLPDRVQEQLAEKTHRYLRLLAAASGAIRPAPEEGIPLRRTADRISAVVSFYRTTGERLVAQGDPGYALACFSYGHGWLDAGVRAGLFSVVSDRHLFTI